MFHCKRCRFCAHRSKGDCDKFGNGMRGYYTQLLKNGLKRFLNKGIRKNKRAKRKKVMILGISKKSEN